jgi:CRP-like cAMP-binding protein
MASLTLAVNGENRAWARVQLGYPYRQKSIASGVIEMGNQENPGFDLPCYLSALPLFHDMERAELARMAEGCTLRRLARGQPVFRIGDPCEEFHLTVTGQVRLFLISPSGQEKVIDIIGPGGTFAEALMFSGRPYILNAEAVVDTLLVTIPKQVVLDEIARDPRFSLRMLAGVSHRLHVLVRDVEAYTLHSGAQRVIGYLLRACEGDPSEPFTVSLPVSKAMIASRLSLTPEYFSRVLHELEAQALIKIDRRDIHIREPQRLARYQLR